MAHQSKHASSWALATDTKKQQDCGKKRKEIDNFFPDDSIETYKKERARGRSCLRRHGWCCGVMLVGLGFVVGFAGGFYAGQHVGNVCQLNSK